MTQSPQPPKALELGSNESALGPSPNVGPALLAAAERYHRYPRGNALELRTAIAETNQVNPDQVVIGNGSADVLMAIGASYLGPGLNLVVSRPTFYVHTFMTERAGGEPRYVRTVGLQQNLDGLLEAVDDDTRIVVLTNPHSPTGSHLTGAMLSQFVGRVPDHVVLVIDEAYTEYATADDFPDSIDHVRAERRVIVTRTFSKAYGLAGMRVGYAITTPDTIKVLQGYIPPFNVNSASLVAALAAWNDQDHLQRVVQLNARERQRIHRTLTSIGLNVVPTEANFLLIVELDDPFAVATEMERRGIIVRPTVEDFGLPGGLRITIGTVDENDRMLEAITEAIS